MPTHRAEVEAFWNSPVNIAGKPGLTATEMFEALADDKLKAIWIINTNPLVSMPDVNAAEKALEKRPFCGGAGRIEPGRYRTVCRCGASCCRLARKRRHHDQRRTPDCVPAQSDRRSRRSLA